MNSTEHPSSSLRWGKRLFRLVALSLVAWGIWHSIRNSTQTLGEQQAQLEEQASRLRAEAVQAIDPVEKQQLQQRAQRLSGQANQFWQASPKGLLLAGCLYAVGMLPPSLFWRRLLIAFEQTNHLLDIMWAYFYGNLGKYFPGKAMVIVLRLAALEPHAVKKTATSVTIFMETLTMMSVGGAVAALCLILLNLDWRLTVLAVGLLVATFIPTSPPVIQYLLPRLQKGVETSTLVQWTQRITWPLFFRGWITLTVGWLLNGLSLWMVLQSLPSSEMADADWSVSVLSSCGACALAVVLGFVSLIPGGAGVREVVITAVLNPVVGPIAALCGAIWLRIVWLGTELSVVGILAAIRYWTPSARCPQPIQLNSVRES